MSCRLLALVTILLLPIVTSAQDKGHAHQHALQAISANDAPIEITINPEDRVSATTAGPVPRSAACGTAVEWRVRIVNEGFLTSRLEAEFVGLVPAGVALDFRPDPLRGVPEELRSLYITLTKPGPTDLTIAFKAHNMIPDLGGRDHLHFLISCMPDASRPLSSIQAHP